MGGGGGGEFGCEFLTVARDIQSKNQIILYT